MTTNTPATISEQAIGANAGVSNLPAPTMTAADLLASLTSKGFKVAKQVTKTVLQQREGEPFAVRFVAEAYEGQELAAGRGGAPKMQPARLCDVINLESGSLQNLIMNTVLEGELNRNYPGGDYVGRMFVIRGYKPIDADGKPKSYRVYEIVEIEQSGDGITPTAVADGTEPVNRKGEKPKG